MRNKFLEFGIEGGNYTPPAVDVTLITPDSTVETDNTSGDATVKPTDEPIVESNSDNSNTIKIDTQDQDVSGDMVPKKKMVFLGGTCNESKWREKLIEGLTISYFDPVVQNWTEDDKEKENQIKDSADFNLFVFTPKHTGYFSFVEAALLAVKSPSRTILCVLQDDDGSTFEEAKKRSIEGIVAELSKENIKVFDNLDDVRSYLNGQETPAPAEPEENTETETTDTDTAELETNDAAVSVKVDTGETTEEEPKDE